MGWKEWGMGGVAGTRCEQHLLEYTFLSVLTFRTMGTFHISLPQ